MRPAAAIAAGAILAALAWPVTGTPPAARAAVAARPLSAGQATAATAAASPAPGTGSPGTSGSAAATDSAGVPKLGSYAARSIGGPLMARRGLVVHEPATGSRPLPSIPASAWVIANASTGQVLAAQDPHGEFGPASTLKVLTAVTLIPLLNPNGMVVASPLATSQQPNIAGLITGRAYKVSALFQALLLISANDAAVALTQAAGSFAHGMALINAEARHLQAYDVVAKLPNGLPAAGQVTSAYDEALIARQALALPAFMKYDETLAARFEVKPHDWETLLNQNYLLTNYRGGIGGKIGWTVSSEATYVGLARRDGVTLIATVLHCTSLQEITSAEKLLNWGFAMNGKVTPVGTLVPPLAGGSSGRSTPATAAGGRRTPAPHASAAAQPAAVSTTRAGPGKAGTSRTVALSAAQPGSGSNSTGYALAVSGVVVAALGLGALARTRRPATGRHRPQPPGSP